MTKNSLIVNLTFLAFLISPLKSAADLPNSVGFLFAHGFGGSKACLQWYIPGNSRNWSIISSPYQTFNFPEVNEHGPLFAHKGNMGQEKDIEALQQAYNLFSKQVKEVVLVGLSRGASTIINYAATKPKNLKALVLESPFDTIENVIAYQLKKRSLHWIPGAQKIAYSIARKNFQAYNSRGVKPLDRITHIDKNIPILFVHSKKDELIPIESSRRLYKKLKDQGFKDIYLLELETGAHAAYQASSDAFKYQATVHAFYATYGIPHDPQLAIQGQQFLADCQNDYKLKSKL